MIQCSSYRLLQSGKSFYDEPGIGSVLLEADFKLQKCSFDIQNTPNIILVLLIATKRFNNRLHSNKRNVKISDRRIRYNHKRSRSKVVQTAFCSQAAKKKQLITQNTCSFFSFRQKGCRCCFARQVVLGNGNPNTNSCSNYLKSSDYNQSYCGKQHSFCVVGSGICGRQFELMECFRQVQLGYRRCFAHNVPFKACAL